MLRLALPAVALTAVLFAGPAARAADPPDPLRYIPADAQVVAKVEKPRQLAEAVVSLDAFKAAQKIPQVRGVLDSPTARRAFQMLAYFEKELGAKWPELLDQLAGGGVAVGATLEADAPALLVVQGTDEKQVERAYALLLRVID